MTDGDLGWGDYECRSKNLALSVSPPLHSRGFSPGQIFKLRLTLGPNISLNSYDKINVRLCGESTVNVKVSFSL